MKQTVTLLSGAVHPVRVEPSTHAFVDIAYPACSAPAPVRVQGKDMHIGSDDRHYQATGFAVCCGGHIGTLRAFPSTIFGLHEDEAVLLHGRARVY